MSNIVKADYVRLDLENKINIDAVSPKVIRLPVAAVQEKDPYEVEGEPFVFNYEVLAEKARRDAESIMKRAQEGAQLILTEAAARADADKAEALEKSKAEGYDEGFRLGGEAAEALKAEARAELERATDEKNKVIATAESDMVDLITKITEKLLANAVTLNPSVVVFIVRQALSGLSGTGDMTVRVCPADYDALVGAKEQILPEGMDSVKIEFDKDETMKPGECVIETPLGDVDCGLGTQFEGLKRDLYLILNA